MIVYNPEEDFAIQKEELEQDGVDEEKVIAVIALKVEKYLNSNPDLLMSYLYRLDVQEKRIKRALENAEEYPANIVLAKLIWTRQKERLQTRQKYRSKSDRDWWDDF